MSKRPPSRRSPMTQEAPMRGVTRWATPPPKTPLQVLADFAVEETNHFYGFHPKELVITRIRRAAASVDGELRSALETLAGEFETAIRPCVTREMIAQIYALVA